MAAALHDTACDTPFSKRMPALPSKLGTAASKESSDCNFCNNSPTSPLQADTPFGTRSDPVNDPVLKNSLSLVDGPASQNGLLSLGSDPPLQKTPSGSEKDTVGPTDGPVLQRIPSVPKFSNKLLATLLRFKHPRFALPRLVLELSEVLEVRGAISQSSAGFPALASLPVCRTTLVRLRSLVANFIFAVVVRLSFCGDTVAGA